MKQSIKWTGAPNYVTFGANIVMSDFAIDKDHTLTFYCDQEVLDKVNKMLESVLEYEPLGAN